MYSADAAIGSFHVVARLLERESQAIVFVDDIQHEVVLAAKTRIVHEVDRPDLLRPFGRRA